MFRAFLEKKKKTTYCNCPCKNEVSPYFKIFQETKNRFKNIVLRIKLI